MDPLKIMERKIMAWGTIALFVLFLIDAILFARVKSVQKTIDLVPKAHARFDSLLVVHDLKSESDLAEIKAEIRELRERLGVDD